ncbi:DUF998 domain-containing protein [Lysobacter solisilvae (ex Woo and Kim 2020)]|uniref:DUF998 domain-containing protein n=1 Tax=Agrilutibacter terrestris TaxID=2865112 RepID=A0A7H0FW05_9GAMM|nr:DUF998 domain-containing protein [Lysobacter terrestris]QNP40221.1 DUF998 domain-containing protein [Lysobacter terrestris]
MKALLAFVSRHAAMVALWLFVASAWLFAARVAEYSHARHPLALLGAAPLPGAAWFNLLAFVLPGLLLASVAMRLRAQLARTGAPQARRWLPRIGAQLMLVAAVAFAAQGVFRLDANELDGAQNGPHAAAWMVWLIGFVAGGVLLGIGLRGAAQWQGLAMVSLAAAVLLPVVALLLPGWVPAGYAQRLAFGLWFAWAIAAEARIAANARNP